MLGVVEKEQEDPNYGEFDWINSAAVCLSCHYMTPDELAEAWGVKPGKYAGQLVPGG